VVQAIAQHPCISFALGVAKQRKHTRLARTDFNPFGILQESD